MITVQSGTRLADFLRETATINRLRRLYSLKHRENGETSVTVTTFWIRTHEGMTTPPPSTPRVLTTDEEARVRALRNGKRVRAPRAVRGIVSSLAATLDADVALVARRGNVWVTVADSGFTQLLPPTADPQWATFVSLVAADAGSRRPWIANAVEWSVIPLGSRDQPQAALLVTGDWTSSLARLEEIVPALGLAVHARLAHGRNRLNALVHRLTRELASARGLEAVATTVLQHVIRAVPSRFATFAVAGEEGELQIVATHGYPVTLVQDVRISPGVGVIGTVYRRRAPLCVADVTGRPDLQRRRPRYRTKSFLALPVLSGAAVTGVVCVTDRLDQQPFDREDVSVLRALIAPAGLALLRERAETQALTFARAATIDPVSGLFNRRYFHARLEEELERSIRQETSVALLMIDVDDFKQINDVYGHPAGDTVIRDISDILRRSVRLFDICTRFGGEEFAVLMPAANAENAIHIAERIRERIATYQPSEVAMHSLRVTASIGLAVATSRSAQALIETADRALYRAKHAGKNRVVQTSLEDSSIRDQNRDQNS